MAELHDRRPAIAAGLPKGADPADFTHSRIETSIGPMRVLGSAAELRAVAEWRAQLARVATALEPYTLWTFEDVEQLVTRWGDGLGANLRAHGGELAGYATIAAGDLHRSSGETGRVEQANSTPIDYVARSVALIAAARRPSEADASADPLATDGGARLRQARKRWRDRVAEGVEYP